MTTIKGEPFEYRQVAANRWIGRSAYGAHESDTEEGIVRSITEELAAHDPPCPGEDHPNTEDADAL